MRRLVLATIAAASVALSAPAAAQAPTARLRDLGDLAELRSAFDSDTGKVRIVLLLSPT